VPLFGLLQTVAVMEIARGARIWRSDRHGPPSEGCMAHAMHCSLDIGYWRIDREPYTDVKNSL